MRTRILFSGYYGLGNAGDEAVLAASVQLFRRLRPEVRIEVLSANVAATKTVLGVDATPRMDPAAVVGAIRRCDLFLSGGGSLLQDTTSLQSLCYYLALLILARRLGKKTMVYAQGIGPLHRAAARRMTGRVLRRVDAITVRDVESADLMRAVGVDGPGAPNVEVTADPVFALDPKVTDRVHRVALERPVAAVSLRPWPGVEHILEPLAEAFAPYRGILNVQAWPLFLDQDLELCRRWAALTPGAQVQEEVLDPAEWMALAGWTDVVIGMRLHALIFGAARGARLLGISYDPKVDALLGRLRVRPIGTPDRLDIGALRTGIDAALAEEDTRWKDRQARAAHLREAAERNVTRALALLDGD